MVEVALPAHYYLAGGMMRWLWAALVLADGGQHPATRNVTVTAE